MSSCVVCEIFRSTKDPHEAIGQLVASENGLQLIQLHCDTLHTLLMKWNIDVFVGFERKDWQYDQANTEQHISLLERLPTPTEVFLIQKKIPHPCFSCDGSSRTGIEFCDAAPQVVYERSEPVNKHKILSILNGHITSDCSDQQQRSRSKAWIKVLSEFEWTIAAAPGMISPRNRAPHMRIMLPVGAFVFNTKLVSGIRLVFLRLPDPPTLTHVHVVKNDDRKRPFDFESRQRLIEFAIRNSPKEESLKHLHEDLNRYWKEMLTARVANDWEKWRTLCMSARRVCLRLMRPQRLKESAVPTKPKKTKTAKKKSVKSPVASTSTLIDSALQVEEDNSPTTEPEEHVQFGDCDDPLPFFNAQLCARRLRRMQRISELLNQITEFQEHIRALQLEDAMDA